MVIFSTYLMDFLTSNQVRKSLFGWQSGWLLTERTWIRLRLMFKYLVCYRKRLTWRYQVTFGCGNVSKCSLTIPRLEYFMKQIKFENCMEITIHIKIFLLSLVVVVAGCWTNPVSRLTNIHLSITGFYFCVTRTELLGIDWNKISTFKTHCRLIRQHEQQKWMAFNRFNYSLNLFFCLPRRYKSQK